MSRVKNRLNQLREDITAARLNYGGGGGAGISFRLPKVRVGTRLKAAGTAAGVAGATIGSVPKPTTSTRKKGFASRDFAIKAPTVSRSVPVTKAPPVTTEPARDFALKAPTVSRSVPVTKAPPAIPTTTTTTKAPAIPTTTTTTKAPAIPTTTAPKVATATKVAAVPKVATATKVATAQPTSAPKPRKPKSRRTRTRRLRPGDDSDDKDKEQREYTPYSRKAPSTIYSRVADILRGK